MLNLCECGCGQECKRKFVRGHNGRGRHHSWSKDKYLIHTKEQRENGLNVCICGCGQRCKNKFVHGHNSVGNKVNLGRKHSEEAKEKIRITSLGRKQTDETIVKKRKTRQKNYLIRTPEQKAVWAENVCRRALANIGKHHSKETIALMSKVQKERYIKNGDKIIAKIVEKSGRKRFLYLSLDGSIIKMRSNWERLYAKDLDGSCIEWQYEPKGFLLSNGHRYYPDFYLPKSNEWHEVKGWMSPSSQEKIDLFQKDYPNERLVIIRGVFEKKLNSGKASIITRVYLIKDF